MKTFVLIHGACQGGWIWDEVAEFIKQDHPAYPIYTPTLTGMAERVNLLTKAVTMQTHIDEVVALIRDEKLQDVVLVGYSYSGLITPAVNEEVPEAISQLVFLDSYLPQSGKTGFEILEKYYQESWQHVADTQGQGWLMPADESSLDIWGVRDPKLRTKMVTKITPFSMNFLHTPVTLTERYERVKKSYIRCTEQTYVSDLMLPYYEQARHLGWPVYELATGHVPMLTRAAELGKILLSV